MYDKKADTITHSHIYDILNFIPKNSAIIMNDTKVIKARLFGKKSTGGEVELLYVRDIDEFKHEVLVRGKVKVGSEIFFSEHLLATVVELLDDGARMVEFYSDGCRLDFTALLPFLDSLGHIPLPPYMDRDDDEDDSISYQTAFASNAGSVAAPTASLHFDAQLLNKIQCQNRSAFVTLHIGLGTFKNVEADDIRDHQIHTERYFISDEAREIIDSKADILCFGTTACRSVEHYFATKSQRGECDTFLNPSRLPKRVNHLLTNFHLPKSTLIMLVASMVGLDKTMELYKIAVENRYRFFSFGDAMLIL